MRAVQYSNLGHASALGATRPTRDITAPTYDRDCGQPGDVKTSRSLIDRAIKKDQKTPALAKTALLQLDGHTVSPRRLLAPSQCTRVVRVFLAIAFLSLFSVELFPRFPLYIDPSSRPESSSRISCSSLCILPLNAVA